MLKNNFLEASGPTLPAVAENASIQVSGQPDPKKMKLDNDQCDQNNDHEMHPVLRSEPQQQDEHFSGDCQMGGWILR